MTTFPAWLTLEQYRDDPVGDFANLVLPDKHCPGPHADLADWLAYLGRRNDPPWVLESLEIAWDEYQLYILTQSWEEVNHAR